jgi:hypothetical protein
MSGRDGLELSSDSDDGAPVYNGAPAQLIRSRGDTQAGMAVAEEQQQYSSSDSSSSGEEEEDEHQRHEEADAVLKVDDEFDSFEDLQLVATRCCLCKLSHNPRKENAVAARKWLKDLLPNLSHYHTSGSLYCFQAFTTINQLKHARTSCPCHISYVLTRNLKWKVTKADINHNHAVLAPVVVGISGLKHIQRPEDLNVDECVAVKLWLEARMVTAQVRYHFRQKFIGSEITRKCVRKMREQLKKDLDPHAMDRLVDIVHEYAKNGGVGRIRHDQFRIKSIVMQHPLMREIARVFGICVTVDGTHKTSKYESSTLVNCVCMDSFGKLACCGVLFNESESESAIEDLLNECGITNVLKTLISDESKAALSFISKHPRRYVVELIFKQPASSLMHDTFRAQPFPSFLQVKRTCLP